MWKVAVACILSFGQRVPLEEKTKGKTENDRVTIRNELFKLGQTVDQFLFTVCLNFYYN